MHPDSSGLVGIARLAFESEVLEEKRLVEYRELETRKLLNRVINSGRKVPFEWSINPYRGCEYGCTYCYARYTHEFMELRDPEQFERLIFTKHLDPVAFRRELSKVPFGEAIAIGTATDPYQPAERRYGVTRRILEIFVEEKGRNLTLTSKSDLIARDAELLATIGRQNAVAVFQTITTLDESLARVLEPYAPRPSLRIESVRKLVAAGVPVGVMASPVLPLINDSKESLSAVASAAAAAGASWFCAGPLFLKASAQKAFFPMLEARFPHLVHRYRQRYERSAYLNGYYPEMLAERVRSIREQFGLAARPAQVEHHVSMAEAQLTLFQIA